MRTSQLGAILPPNAILVKVGQERGRAQVRHDGRLHSYRDDVQPHARFLQRRQERMESCEPLGTSKVGKDLLLAHGLEELEVVGDSPQLHALQERRCRNRAIEVEEERLNRGRAGRRH